MKISLDIDGSPLEPGADGKPLPNRWVECSGRATVKLTVVWTPPASTAAVVGPNTSPIAADTAKALDDTPPRLTIAYFSVLGSPSDHFGTVAHPSGDPSAWTSVASFQAPLFFPLRVRVELQPALGRPISHTLHVIPRASARVATAIAVASLLVATVLLTRVLTTLRLTMMQALTGASGAALLSAAGYVLRVGVARRDGSLPLLGVAHLLHRSVAAALIGLVALSVLLRGYVVVIRNETGDDLRTVFTWRPAADIIAADAQISVVPPNSRAFRERLWSYLDPGDRERPMCLFDLDGPRHGDDACRETDTDDPFRAGARGLLRWFDPPTIAVRCGRRWPGLSARDVIAHSTDIKLVGEAVWLEPVNRCSGNSDAWLWVRQADAAAAAHRVRPGWEPATFDQHGGLWLAAIAGEQGSNGVTLFSAAPSAPGGAPSRLEETRIAVPPNLGDSDHAWPIAGLPSGAESDLELQIGEHLSRLPDPFTPAATLTCHRAQGRGTVFRATRLALRGTPVGWLQKLAVSGAGGLMLGSSWTLTGGASRDVATPWICEARPGDNPKLSSGLRTIQGLTLTVDPEAVTSQDLLAVDLPADLVPARIDVRPSTDPKQSIGIVRCRTSESERDLVAIGRVRFNDHRGGEIHKFTVKVESDQWIDTTGWEWSGEPDRADVGTRSVWLCWRRDAHRQKSYPVEVVPHGSKTPLTGTWNIEAGTLELDPRPPTACFWNTTTGTLTYKKPKHVPTKSADLREYKARHPETRACERIQTYP